MLKGAPVLLALLLIGAANAEDEAVPSAGAGGVAKPAPAAQPLRLPPRESFRLFPQLAPGPRVDFAGVENRRLLHQPGDPDSLFTLGSPTPDGEVHLKAAIEVNEIFLKAIPPDPLVGATDTRPRAAGSFLPVDNQGRPYQLRLGARLVW
jgi:hypothetical protein